MKRRDFVLPMQVVDTFMDIKLMLDEDKARHFLESVVLYGGRGMEVYEPKELAAAILLAQDDIDEHNLPKEIYEEKRKKGI